MKHTVLPKRLGDDMTWTGIGYHMNWGWVEVWDERTDQPCTARWQAGTDIPDLEAALEEVQQAIETRRERWAEQADPRNRDDFDKAHDR